MNVLVTGGTGHLAAYLTRQLLEQGDSVTLFDVSSDYGVLRLVCGDDVLARVTIASGDVTMPTELLAAVMKSGADRIVHLASIMPPTAERDTHLSLSQITGGMANALEAARLTQVKKLVFASATSVFGAPQSHGGPDAVVGDDAPHAPLTLYGITKSTNERLARLYRTRHGLDSIGFRFCQGYGPGKRHGRPYGYRMFEAAVLGTSCRVPYGDDIINWQYVEDAASILTRGLTATYAGIDTYNTTGEITTMGEALAVLRELAPGADITAEPGTAGMIWRYDASRLAQDLGYDRPTPLRRGFAATLETMRDWLRQSRW